MGTEEIKLAGLKVTLPRTRILQIMEDTSTRHMSAEDVYRELLQEEGRQSSIQARITPSIPILRFLEELFIFVSEKSQGADHRVRVRAAETAETGGLDSFA